MMNDVNILAVETATSACSVALNVGDVIFERSEIGNNIHSQCLLSMLEQVLVEAQLTVSELNAVAVGQGPGSFTGLRIGVGVAQGIAYGAGCSMLGISSLAALAHQTNQSGYVLTGIDARMNEVYWGLYKMLDGDVQLLGNLNVSSPNLINHQSVTALAIDFDIDRACLAGNAWVEYEHEFDQAFLMNLKQAENCVYPQASSVLALAHKAYSRQEFVSPIDFAPEYVRNNVAFKKTL